ncbi:hypothetical protein D3C87_1623000 [compost metagenome]
MALSLSGIFDCKGILILIRNIGFSEVGKSLNPANGKSKNAITLNAIDMAMVTFGHFSANGITPLYDQVKKPCSFFRK